jgi:CRISPR/Cas system-associated exonuclease Cas4 (RecB family)
MPNKYSAVWVSHSSIGDFQKCPRAYYLRNVYKNKNKKKISIASPYLSLGVAVHNVLEPLAWVPANERFSKDLFREFDKEFTKFEGKIGGFISDDQYYKFRQQGIDMINNVINNPGPIKKPAVRMLQDKSELPWFWLSEEEEIILCGKCDWLEYNNGNIHVYDFKTGKSTEKDESLQLPIYSILVNKFKKYPLTKAFYWYIAQSVTPVEKKLPSLSNSYDLVLTAAREIAEARKTNNMKCPYSGCRNCEPYERILKGEGKMVGIGEYGAEIYFL